MGLAIITASTWMTFIISLMIKSESHLIEPGKSALGLYNILDVPCVLNFTKYYDSSLPLVDKGSSLELEPVPFIGYQEKIDVAVKCAGYDWKTFKTYLMEERRLNIYIFSRGQDLEMDTYSFKASDITTNSPVVFIFGAQVSDLIYWQDEAGADHIINPNVEEVADVSFFHNRTRSFKLKHQKIMLWKNEQLLLTMDLEIGGIYHIFVSDGDKAVVITKRTPYHIHSAWFFLVLILENIGTCFIQIGVTMYVYVAPPYYLRAHFFAIPQFLNTVFYQLNERVWTLLLPYQFACTATVLTLFLCLMPFIRKKIDRPFSYT